MSLLTLPIAYMPLVDAAPLIIAHEMGFARKQGLYLDLRPAPSWSALRDMLVFGQVSAAHMLAPVPLAMAMGLGGVKVSLSVLSVLSQSGTVVGVGHPLEQRLQDSGYRFDFCNSHLAAQAIEQVWQGPLTIGVPFPISSHVHVLRHWSLPRDKLRIRTVPPPLMADTLAADEIDAFCVGEPWGSVAVERGAGALLLPTTALIDPTPEKVLAVRDAWAEQNPNAAIALIRAVWEAGRWLSQPDSHTVVSEVLSRKSYLDCPPELIERALTGRFVVSSRGEERKTSRFVTFHSDTANFPTPDQRHWIAEQLVQEHDIPMPSPDLQAQVWRSDLFDAALPHQRTALKTATPQSG